MNFQNTSFSILLLGILCSCASGIQPLSTTVLTKPIHYVSPERMVVLNSVNIENSSYRDSKEELFLTILDTTLLKLSREIENRSQVKVAPLLGVTKTGAEKEVRDKAVLMLMSEYTASDAIVITSFDVFFQQTDVEVTKTEGGSRNREAFYDIVSTISYHWYNTDGVFKEDNIESRRFHSSRSVASGLLAAGPNIVKRQDEALVMVKSNLKKYLNLFFPGREDRIRILFVGKEFANVKSSLNAGYFDRALTESQRLLNNPSKKIAAQASYNCAVLLERLGQREEIKSYLENSLQLYPLQEAHEMMGDYHRN